MTVRFQTQAFVADTEMTGLLENDQREFQAQLGTPEK